MNVKGYFFLQNIKFDLPFIIIVPSNIERLNLRLSCVFFFSAEMKLKSRLLTVILNLKTYQLAVRIKNSICS